MLAYAPGKMFIFSETSQINRKQWNLGRERLMPFSRSSRRFFPLSVYADQTAQRSRKSYDAIIKICVTESGAGNCQVANVA